MTRSAGRSSFGGSAGRSRRSSASRAVSYRTSRGCAEYAESDFKRFERDWYDVSYRTLVFPGGVINAPHRELYDGQGVWKLVETYANFGEVECPYRSYKDPRQRIVGGDGEADLLDENGRCQLCDEEQGDEHGYIYLGVCAYEAVYELIEQTTDDEPSVANEWPEGSGG